MENSETVREILQAFMVDECEIVGPANLNAILAGQTNLVRTEFGNNLDLSETIAFLASVAAFLDHAISIAKIRWKGGSATDSHQQSRPEAGTPPAGIDAATLDAIYRHILERVQAAQPTSSTNPPPQRKARKRKSQ